LIPLKSNLAERLLNCARLEYAPGQSMIRAQFDRFDPIMSSRKLLRTRESRRDLTDDSE